MSSEPSPAIGTRPTLTHLELIERGYVTTRRELMRLSLAHTDDDLEGLAGVFDDVLHACGAALGR